MVDPEALDQALRAFVRANLRSKDPLVASCVFALGKRYALDLKRFLVEVLDAVVDTDDDDPE